MSRIVPSKKVGVPVTDAVDAVDLVCYFGATGYTPDYSQANKFAKKIAELEKTTREGQELYVVDLSSIPASNDQTWDLAFTFVDDAGNESDFSLAVAVPLDNVPPSAPGQPVVLE